MDISIFLLAMLSGGSVERHFRTGQKVGWGGVGVCHNFKSICRDFSRLYVFARSTSRLGSDLWLIHLHSLILDLFRASTLD